MYLLVFSNLLELEIPIHTVKPFGRVVSKKFGKFKLHDLRGEGFVLVAIVSVSSALPFPIIVVVTW